MAMLDLFNRPRSVSRTAGDEDSPLINLHREMNEMFEDFWRSFGGALERPGLQQFTPKLDISEDQTAITVRADLPGLEEKDVDVTLSEGVLTIRGEHKEEREEKEEQYYVRERSYGSFQRAISVGQAVDEDKVKASFDKGVLTVTLPKTEEVQKRAKKIPIK